MPALFTACTPKGIAHFEEDQPDIKTLLVVARSESRPELEEKLRMFVVDDGVKIDTDAALFDEIYDRSRTLGVDFVVVDSSLVDCELLWKKRFHPESVQLSTDLVAENMYSL
jgi:hypothetical protein